jgi:enoyl-CoA hydratase
MSTHATNEAPVIARREGGLGRLTMNRARSLNALSLPIIRTLHRALREWRDDPDVATVLIDGDGRAFCAGGDIRVVYDSATQGTDEATDLWREQYLLNVEIVRYPKPVVTVLDGITMGGGVGLGCHATHRVVTDDTMLAMPEVSIGLAPDVGGLLLLARAPGEVGTHLALTASRIRAEEILYCGLADHHVDGSRLEELSTLLQQRPAAEALAKIRTDPAALTPPGLAAARSWIDECYRGDDVAEILGRLREHPHEDAQKAADTLSAMSPLGVTVCLQALRSAARLDDELAVFVQDFRVTVRFLDTHDLAAGIRSAIITKDRTPVWQPTRLADITPAMVARHFESLGTRDLLTGQTTPARR